MRPFHPAVAAFAATLLVASAAHAQHEGGHARESGGGSTGGGAGAGGGSAGGGAGGGATGNGDERTEQREEEQDVLGSRARPWQVTASLETHGLLWQNNLGGSGEDRIFNYYSLYGQVDFLGLNRLWVFGGLYERFLADSGESGVRLDDVVVGYTRFVPLSRQFLFSARLSAALPTSFEAQLMSLLVEPTAAVQIGGRFFNNLLTVDLRGFGSLYVVRYSSYVGGAPNPRGRIGALLTGELSMPFHHPLSVGASAYVAYYWYYDVHNAGDPNITVPTASADPQFGTQPLQQRYGGEVFVRYAFPALFGFHADLRVAVAQGDTSLGYTSFIHDGVGQLYLSYYQNSEIYGTLSVRY